MLVLIWCPTAGPTDAGGHTDSGTISVSRTLVPI